MNKRCINVKYAIRISLMCVCFSCVTANASTLSAKRHTPDVAVLACHTALFMLGAVSCGILVSEQLRKYRGK